MMLKHLKNIYSNDVTASEIFYVEESSNLIGWERFWTKIQKPDFSLKVRRPQAFLCSRKKVQSMIYISKIQNTAFRALFWHFLGSAEPLG